MYSDLFYILSDFISDYLTGLDTLVLMFINTLVCSRFKHQYTLHSRCNLDLISRAIRLQRFRPRALSSHSYKLNENLKPFGDKNPI